MRKPWTLTIVLGLLGLVALPILLGGPELLGGLKGVPELHAFTLFLGILTLLSLCWLAAFLWAIFRHQGRTRTILLASTAAVLITGFVINQIAGKRPVSVSINLPTADQPAER